MLRPTSRSPSTTAVAAVAVVTFTCIGGDGEREKYTQRGSLYESKVSFAGADLLTGSAILRKAIVKRSARHTGPSGRVTGGVFSASTIRKLMVAGTLKTFESHRHVY